MLTWLIFPFGALFLLLHAGPLLGIVREPSIRGGTRWWFFTLELLLFLGWLVCVPAVADSALGRLVIATHMTLHIGFALADWFAHDLLLATALLPRRSSPGLWGASRLGLAVDTACHAIVVGLAALSLPWQVAVLLCVPAVLGYLAVTRVYVRWFEAGV